MNVHQYQRHIIIVNKHALINTQSENKMETQIRGHLCTFFFLQCYGSVLGPHIEQTNIGLLRYMLGSYCIFKKKKLYIFSSSNQVVSSTSVEWQLPALLSFFITKWPSDKLTKFILNHDLIAYSSYFSDQFCYFFYKNVCSCSL